MPPRVEVPKKDVNWDDNDLDHGETPKEVDCVICQDNPETQTFTDDDFEVRKGLPVPAWRNLDCGCEKRFHLGCLNKWFDQKRTCPICCSEGVEIVAPEPEEQEKPQAGKPWPTEEMEDEWIDNVKTGRDLLNKHIQSEVLYGRRTLTWQILEEGSELIYGAFQKIFECDVVYRGTTPEGNAHSAKRFMKEFNKAILGIGPKGFKVIYLATMCKRHEFRCQQAQYRALKKGGMSAAGLLKFCKFKGGWQSHATEYHHILENYRNTGGGAAKWKILAVEAENEFNRMLAGETAKWDATKQALTEYSSEELLKGIDHIPVDLIKQIEDMVRHEHLDYWNPNEDKLNPK